MIYYIWHMDKINIKEKYQKFNDYWKPRVIAKLNDQQVIIAKVKGEFVWHDHKDEDELFTVIKGKLKMEFRDKVVEVNEGEMIVVPKGIEHRPVAEEETWLLLFEPLSTKHTGEVNSELTVEEYPHI